MCFLCICLLVLSVRVSFFCLFFLPLGVGGWLRFVIVALPRLFYYFFWTQAIDKWHHNQWPVRLTCENIYWRKRRDHFVLCLRLISCQFLMKKCLPWNGFQISTINILWHKGYHFHCTKSCQCKYSCFFMLRIDKIVKVLSRTSAELTIRLRYRYRIWIRTKYYIFREFLKVIKGFWQFVRYMPNFLKTRIPFWSPEVPFV